MSIVTRLANCHDCGAVLGPDLTTDQRPCPVCGSTLRDYHVSALEIARKEVGIDLKGKRPGLKRPFIEIREGFDLEQRTGKQVMKHRRIDRDGDVYVETVKDGDRVIHHSEEPLSAHRGHGSAKPKTPGNS